MQESFEPRLRLEFSGESLTEEHRENLHELARKASDRLRKILEGQQKQKEQIEQYEGDDWDVRYGSTGLWRKLSGDIYTTALSRCEIDFHLGLAAEQPQRNELLQKIPAEIESLDQAFNTTYAQFLKARTLALLARTEPACVPLAKEQFNRLMERPDMNHSTALRVSIERIRLLGPTGPDELDNLADEIAQSACSDDIELALSFVSVQRRHDPNALEKAVRRWPQTQDFLGSCVLSELSYWLGQGQLAPQKCSVFEAELAVESAWKNSPRQHSRLLENLANSKKFQSPLILYVTAVAVADSAPAKAVGLLIKAGRLQHLQRSNRLQIPADEIAKQAAQLAYSLFIGKQCDCKLVLEAFENYSNTVAERIDEDLEYIYGTLLNGCRRTEQAVQLLTKIADNQAGKWSNRARLDLIIQAVQERQHEKQKHRSEFLRQLNSLIADCIGQNQSDDNLRTEATAIYCQLLLESKDRDSAQKVLEAIAERDTIHDPNLHVFKSTALRRLGRLNESAGCLLRAMQPNRCEHIGQAVELLAVIVEEIDRFETADLGTLENATILAQLTRDCLDGREKHIATLFLIEISALSATDDEKRPAVSEKLLDSIPEEDARDNVDFIRCRARLLTRQGKFEQAAQVWARLAELRRSDPTPEDRRSWKWWRAKYYELYCRSACPRVDKAGLLHAIEVLENSFTAIPPLWAGKFNTLKEKTK
jgi:hypothetical protein